MSSDNYEYVTIVNNAGGKELWDQLSPSEQAKYMHEHIMEQMRKRMDMEHDIKMEQLRASIRKDYEEFAIELARKYSWWDRITTTISIVTSIGAATFSGYSAVKND